LSNVSASKRNKRYRRGTGGATALMAGNASTFKVPMPSPLESTKCGESTDTLGPNCFPPQSHRFPFSSEPIMPGAMRCLPLHQFVPPQTRTNRIGSDRRTSGHARYIAGPGRAYHIITLHQPHPFPGTGIGIELGLSFSHLSLVQPHP
jgi:hypothetical protein